MTNTAVTWHINDGPGIRATPGDLQMHPQGWRLSLRRRDPAVLRVGDKVTVRGTNGTLTYSGTAIVIDQVSRIEDGQVLYDLNVFEGLAPLAEVPPSGGD